MNRDELAERKSDPERIRLDIIPHAGGGYVVRGRLRPEVGEVLVRGLEAMEDELDREEGRNGAVELSDREAARRRADALALLCERFLTISEVERLRTKDTP